MAPQIHPIKPGDRRGLGHVVGVVVFGGLEHDGLVWPYGGRGRHSRAHTHPTGRAAERCQEKFQTLRVRLSQREREKGEEKSGKGEKASVVWPGKEREGGFKEFQELNFFAPFASGGRGGPAKPAFPKLCVCHRRLFSVGRRSPYVCTTSLTGVSAILALMHI